MTRRIHLRDSKSEASLALVICIMYGFFLGILVGFVIGHWLT